MSKTVAEWQLRATADGWKWNDIEYFWYNDKGERSLYHELEEIYTTHSPDVAGSDAVAFAEWIGKNGWWTEDGLTWFNEISGGDDTVQISTTISELYAKFNPNPQPAGASVGIEKAADSYARETYDDFPYVVVALDAFKAGAAFQAAQGQSWRDTPDFATQVRNHIKSHGHFDWHEALTENEMGYLEDLLFTFHPVLPPGTNGNPAPAAVSAGTWRKASDGLPNLLNGEPFFKVDGEKADGCFLSDEVFEYHKNSKYVGIEKEAFNRVEWLDESAPDIPDVRELVEALEGSLSWLQLMVRNWDADTFMELEFDGIRAFVEQTQTALAGIKRK